MSQQYQRRVESGRKAVVHWLPRELYDRLRDQAHLENRAMVEIVREAIRQYLTKSAEECWAEKAARKGGEPSGAMDLSPTG